MVRTRFPSSSVVDFTKLLCFVVKIEQYSLALYLFDEMLQPNAPVSHYTLAIAIDCFYHLERVDLGFAVLGIQIKRGYETDVVTFTNLIKVLFLVGKVSEAGPNVVSFSILIGALCQDSAMYNVFIQGLAKSKEIDVAIPLLEEMKTRGFMLDATTFSLWSEHLQVDGQHGLFVDKVKKLYQRTLIACIGFLTCWPPWNGFLSVLVLMM